MKLINLTRLKFKKIDVPFIVWMVIASTFVAIAIQFPILGRNISGWAWVVPFIVSVIIIMQRASSVTLPSNIWLPWICIVVFYFADSHFSYPQRNIMLLCPIIVGMAASTHSIREIEIQNFLKLIRVFLFAFFFVVLVKTGLLFTGRLPGATGLAPQSMTAALLCSIFAVEYSINGKSSLFNWALGATAPVIGLMRMGIAAAGATIPFTFAPLGLKKRAVFLTIIACLTIALFYTERVQRKMFYSGRGTLEDVRLSNPDFFTTGRARLWDLMIEEIKEKPWFGHGANAQEQFIFDCVGFYGQPHNDWLRLLFDYGYLGASVFAFCIILQTLHAWSKARVTTGGTRMLFYAGSSAFLPFVLFMFTDNIILYVSFFGNLHFTILGLAYASLSTSTKDAAWYQYRAYLSSRFESNNSFQKTAMPYDFPGQRNSPRR